MSESSKSKWGYILTYAALLGVSNIILNVILYVSGYQLAPWAKWLTYPLLILWVALGIKSYKEKELNGFISYGNAFSIGFFISFIGGLIGLVYMMIFVSYIDPDYMNKILEISEQTMVDKGMSESSIEHALSMQRKFMSPLWFSLLGTLGIAFSSLIISLLVSLFLKKDDPSFESNFTE